MLVELDPDQKRQRDKFRISCMDIAHALQCARFVIKKGWHSHEWERRGTIYLQQPAFTTSLVVSYARPFIPARGLSGLPARLIKWTDEEKSPARPDCKASERGVRPFRRDILLLPAMASRGSDHGD
jgi:hypothetical protein